MQRAFSLIELVIVLAIVATMAAIAAPRYANAAARYRADAAARRVGADLELAAVQARMLGKAVTVTFNTATATYSIAGVEDLRHRAGDYTVALAAEPYRCTLVSATFGGPSQVTYTFYGTAAAGGQVVVRSGAYTRTATLDPVSGKVTIQ
jgi:prepilin-type N-terminal cleavage/methylation domain-containing protein